MRSEVFYPMVNERAANQETGQTQSLRYGALLLIGVALYAARYWLHWDRFIESTMDEAIWLPLAMRWNGKNGSPSPINISSKQKQPRSIPS